MNESSPEVRGNWRYYKNGDWYCKINIESPHPLSIEDALQEISVFLPEETQNILEHYIAAPEDAVDEYDDEDDGFELDEDISATGIIAYFLLEHPAKWETLIAAPRVGIQNDYPKGIYQGFGKILRWMDSLHLLSYHEESNRVYLLTCRSPGKTLLYSILDAYTFWPAIDITKTIADFNLPQNAEHRNALLVNADQWLLGVWGIHGDFVSCDEDLLKLMHEMDIDMFDMNMKQKVVRAYFMNQASESSLENHEWGDIEVDGYRYKTGSQEVISVEKTITGKEGDVITERNYIYADGKAYGICLYSPCVIKCPLSDMHIIADCRCKHGDKSEEYAAVKQQIELYDQRDGGYFINGCLTDDDLVIYKCAFADMNLPVRERENEGGSDRS
jgi:hypothetical protein